MGIYSVQQHLCRLLRGWFVHRNQYTAWASIQFTGLLLFRFWRYFTTVQSSLFHKKKSGKKFREVTMVASK
jgi:hypothetical protein